MRQGAFDKGYTLAEILIVVTILGIAALVAIPDFSSSTHKLDLAVAETVQALRYARSEAMRTGTVHGVAISEATDRIQVLKVSAASFKPDLVRHPVDKKFYNLDFQTDRQLRGVTISNVLFNWEGLGLLPAIGFSDAGVPQLPAAVFGATHLLIGASLVVSYDGVSRVIAVDPMTGRVTVR